MADEVVKKIRVEVDSESTLKEVKDLRQEFAAVEDKIFEMAAAGKQNTNEYRQATKEAARLKQGVDNINESLDDLKPEATLGAFGRLATGAASGFAAAQGAAALFGDESEELQKTLVKVQAAMAFSEGLKGLKDLGKGFKILGAVVKINPIFLLASVIIGIGVAIAAATKKFKFLNDTFTAIGDAISWLIQGFKDFTDWIGISSFALDEAAEKELENITKVGDALQSKYDRQIALDKAAGKSTVETEKIKQRAIIETAVLEARLMEEALKRNGELTEEETERLDELLKIVADAKLQIDVLDIQETTKKKAQLAQQTKDRKAEHKKQQDEERAHQEELQRIWNLAQAELLGQKLEAEEADKAKKEEEAIEAALELNEEIQTEEETAEKKKRIAERLADFKKRLRQIELEESLASAEQGNAAIAGLANALFETQLNLAQGNEKKELEIRKRQFKANKAFGIVDATITGIRAVQQALANPYPLNIVLAAISGAAAAANVAKIASQRFDGGGSAGGGGSVGGSIGGSIQAPRVQAPTQGGTQLDENGQIIEDGIKDAPPVKAVVVETDITSTQNSVGQIQDKATL